MRKIFSHREGVALNPLTIIDNTKLDTFIDLGMTTEGLRFTSFDVDNVEITEQNEDTNFKVYDLTVNEDAELLLEIAFSFQPVSMFASQTKAELTGDVYELVKKAINDPDALKALFEETDNKINAKLVELGFLPE